MSTLHSKAEDLADSTTGKTHFTVFCGTINHGLAQCLLDAMVTSLQQTGQEGLISNVPEMKVQSLPSRLPPRQ
jgi:hypothetical protein